MDGSAESIEMGIVEREERALAQGRAKMENPKKKKSKFGMGFYIMLVLTIVKDISDLLFNLSVILSPITFLTGLFMDAVLFGYFFFIGVKPDVRKVTAFAISSIIDLVPIASFLPLTTLNLVIIRYLEGKETK